MYVPNSTLQCLPYCIFLTVIIALGLSRSCTPSLWGKLCNQNTQLYTISTINHGGYSLNGSTVAILLTRCFSVLMYLSISGTCSFAEHILRMTPFCWISCCICWNCPSPRIALILKPHAVYACITCSIDVISVAFFISYTSLAVPKCILCDVVIMKGTLLMKITSIARVTSPCFSIISLGRSSKFTCTCSCLVHVVFPFLDPRFGPKMSSALRMSFLVIGQFGIMFLST